MNVTNDAVQHLIALLVSSFEHSVIHSMIERLATRLGPRMRPGKLNIMDTRNVMYHIIVVLDAHLVS